MREIGKYRGRCVGNGEWAYGTKWRELVATIAEAIAKAKEGEGK